MEPPFKTGDEVRLKTGKSKIIVYEVDYFEEGDQIPHYAKRNWGSSNYKKRYKPNAGWFIRFGYASSQHYQTNYGDGDHHRKWREAEDFVYYHPQEQKEPIMTKPSLYQTKEDPVRYGTFLIKNSQGKMVLEMKGEGGKCEPFAEDEIEVVTPHTVEFTQLNMASGEKSHSIHIVTKKGQVAKDDVFLELNSGRIYRATQVDSKCLSPRDNKSKWMKIPAEFVTLGEQ